MPNVAGYESALTKHSPNGQCPGFVIGGKTEGPKAESGGGFLGRGQQPPPPPTRGLEERCELPKLGVRGRTLTVQRFSTIFSTQGGLCRHYNIVNCGLSCSNWGGGKTPVPPCVRRADWCDVECQPRNPMT